MDYHRTITTLFTLLSQANKADSREAAVWQKSSDSYQNREGALGGHYYGHLEESIISIAGDAIVEHWAETGELDLSLANRNPAAGIAETSPPLKSQPLELSVVRVTVEGGVVQHVDVPEGVQVVVKDYDTDGSEEDLQHDDNGEDGEPGDEFVESTWTHIAP